MTVLGDRIEDPHSVKNLNKAYSNLINSGVLSNKKDSINATHLYVKFKPEDGRDLNRLINNDDLILFDYPLDYEVKVHGDYYPDPNLDKGEIPWLYSVVPVDFEFPDVKYKVIYECYYPEKLKSDNMVTTLDRDLYLRILEESYRLTGTLDRMRQKGTESFEKSPHPKGRFRVRDNTRNLDLGIRYVKVITQWGTNIGSAYTDTAGYFEIENASYIFDPWYMIEYHNLNGFKIFAGLIPYMIFRTNFGQQDMWWFSEEIQYESDHWKYGTLNNAIVKYRAVCDVLNINKPPSDLRLWVLDVDGQGSGAAPMLYRTFGIYGLTTNAQITSLFL